MAIQRTLFKRNEMRIRRHVIGHCPAGSGGAGQYVVLNLPALYLNGNRVSGLICGVCCQTAVMLLWNYLIAPVYMGYTREAVAELLLPAFLPFNLIKGGLNAAATLLLYKPVITALRRLNLIEPTRSPEKARLNIGVILTALLILITCILLILSFRDII